MGWHQLTDNSQIEALAQASHQRPQVIFKHSTRCSISDMAKSRMDRSLTELEPYAELHFLDLIKYRDTSNYIAEFFSVTHQSPQILVIRSGECILEQSHYDVRPDEITEVLTAGIRA